MRRFCLTITKNGAKSFAVHYRVIGKRTMKIMTLRGNLKLKDTPQAGKGASRDSRGRR